MEKTDVPFFLGTIAIRAATFASLAELAVQQISKMNGEAEIVCGPISTGGYGNAVVNLLVFNHAIEVLKGHGRPVWSQMPFEAGLADLEHRWKVEHPGEGYCAPILSEFYARLFDRRFVRRAWFLGGPQGWETSFGARWEWDRLGVLGIDRRIFLPEWHRTCILPKDL